MLEDYMQPQALGTTPEEVEAPAKDILGDLPLIVVTNREPWEHVRAPDGSIAAKQPAGGVVSALDPLMQALGGMWIAWGSGSADREMVDARDHVQLPPEEGRYVLRRVWMTDEEVEKFYEGHANQTLWPLCHSHTHRVRFRQSEWEAYQSVNERFARVASEELARLRPSQQETAKQGFAAAGVVWFHDYQFTTAPAMLRELRSNAIILQFWHIPWPPWEIFRQHPKRREILEGFLGSDLIGMHIDLYCENFLDCVERELHLPVDRTKMHVVLGNRIIRLRAIPISIDAARFDRLARSHKATRIAEHFRASHHLNSARLGIGVERSDYTKGILLKLAALESFFEKYPQWREHFSFVQVSTPSRQKIPAYAVFAADVRRTVHRINARFQTPTWKPIIHLTSEQSQLKLAALYRMADVGIVSVRQDGMNLVSKEYVASQVDAPGVLILSEFAGAADELIQAISINPYDVEGFAGAIDRALSMSKEERTNRMQQLREHLFSHTIYDWLAEFFHALAPLLDGARDPTGGPLLLLDHLEDLNGNLRSKPHIELFCDYDGVLTPIAPRPTEARLDQHMQGLLTKLRDSASVHVSVISGRQLSDVAELVSIERLTYAGNHGLEISGPRARKVHPAAAHVHDVIRAVYETLRREMQDEPGVIIEDKQLGVALHYRLALQTQVPAILDRFQRTVARYNAGQILRTTSGKSVVEVRPNVKWDKGKAVLWLLRTLHGPDWKSSVLPIYLGDDETDEDAFRALRLEGITVVVGNPTVTAARFRLDGTSDVAVFLEWLVQNIH